MAKKDTTTVAVKKKTAKKKATIKKAVKKKAVAKKTAAKTASPAKKRAKKTQISAEEKRMMVALHAYYKWENSGRPDNAETQHWFEAEREIEKMLG